MQIDHIIMHDFGKLSGCEIKPCSGLNILYAPNESGKTTLLSFIKYMLYGCKQKKHTGDIAFKEKYMPWNGNPIKGILEVTSANHTYRIERGDGMKNGSKYCRVFDGITGQNYSAIKDPGAYLLKMGEQSFSKTAFISILSEVNGEDREGDLLRALSEGQNSDDNNSYVAIKNVLEEQIAQISSSRREHATLVIVQKEMNKVQKELVCVKDKIDKINENIQSAQKAKTSLKEIKNELDQLCLQRKAAQFQAAKEQSQYLQHRLKSEEKAKNDLCTKLDTIRTQSHCLPKASEQEQTVMKMSTQGIDEEMKLILSQKKNYIYKTGFSALLFLFALIASLYSPFCLLATPILGYAFFTVKQWFRKNKRIRLLREEKEKLLQLQKELWHKYGVNTYKEYKERADQSEKKTEIIASLSAQLELQNKILQELHARINDSEDILNAIDYNFKFNGNGINHFTNENIDDIINQKEKKAEKLTWLIASFSHEEDDLASLIQKQSELNAALEQLDIQKKEAEYRLSVYSKALMILNSAHNQLKEVFAPLLAKKTADLLSEITGGKYKSLLTDDQFKVTVCYNNEFKDSRYLSSGTLDALYFSLRLAIIDCISDKNESIPIFLDDIFSQCDESRTKVMLEFLKEYAKVHQVFFCTCRKYEGEYFKNDQTVNTIRM